MEGDLTRGAVEVAEGMVEALPEPMIESVSGTWHSFLEHLPYLVAGAAVLLATVVVGSMVSKLARYVLRKKKGLRWSLQELVRRMAVAAVWFFGLLLAAMVVFPGLTPTKALGGLGIASVAIGFAFKDIFENFFAGILLLWKFPFEEGDFIECDGTTGRVLKVELRMTTLRESGGELVVMPNAKLFNNRVTVLTQLPTRRVGLEVGIDYGANLNKAVEEIETALFLCDTVEHAKPMHVLPKAFGTSSVDIEVLWWCKSTPMGERESRAQVLGEIKKALDTASISIPFPQRVVHIQGHQSGISETELASSLGRDDSL